MPRDLEYWAGLYDFCIAGYDDDCERGFQHEGPCGPKTTTNEEIS